MKILVKKIKSQNKNLYKKVHIKNSLKYRKQRHGTLLGSNESAILFPRKEIIFMRKVCSR